MAAPTVVLIPFCVTGHLTSMLQAGKRMLSSGGDDRAMSLTVLLAPLPMARFAHIVEREATSGSGFDIRFHRLPYVELPAFTSPEDMISSFIQLHASNAKAAIAGLGCPVAAVVMDYFCTTLFDVTHELALPVYVYFTSPASMLALMLRLPALDQEVAGDFGEAGAAFDVPGMPPVPAAFLPNAVMKRDSAYRWSMYHANRFMEAAGIIVNTVAEVEPESLAAIADGRCMPGGRRVPTIYPIGPVIAFDPPAEQPHDECLRWLDAQPRSSVVLLCFGSMGNLTLPQVHEIAEGLQRSEHRFLWVLRGPPPAGSPYPTDATVEELVPGGFLERTKERGLVWPRWAPQKEILSHPSIGGFVSHGGWNSTLESLWHGVPLVTWPLYAEQHMNAFVLVAALGVAVAMEVDRKRGNFVEAAELERAVRTLMGGSEEGREARAKAAEAKAACRNAVEEGGSSCAALQRLMREISGHGGA